MEFLTRFNLFKLALVLLLAVYFARTFFLPDFQVMNTFLHSFLLAIHEAGHFLTPFGRFFAILGGTLWQIFIPIKFVLYFALTRQFYSSALVLFLVSFSFVDAAVYVGDASERALPLITLDPGTHDWWNLLRLLGILEYDKALARLFYMQGWLFFALACYFGVTFSKKDIQSVL